MSTNQDPTGTLSALLDAIDATPGATQLRARSYDLLPLDPGAAVVDVGCGTGQAVGEMRQRGACPVGIDADEEMVNLARSRWPGADIWHGDALHLPFGDGQLHGYRGDKVLHDLADPACALAEARRVLAPGGRVVLLGQDWDTVVIDADDPGLTRAIVHARADQVPAPRAARRYRNLLLDAGFHDVTVEVHTGVFTGPLMLPMLMGLAAAARASGAIDGAQADAWTAEQRRRADRGRLFLALPMFLAAATRGAAT